MKTQNKVDMSTVVLHTPHNSACSDQKEGEIDDTTT